MGKTTEPPGSSSLEAQDAIPFFIIQAEDPRSSEEEALCQQRLGTPAKLLGSPCLGFWELDYTSCEGRELSIRGSPWIQTYTSSLTELSWPQFMNMQPPTAACKGDGKVTRTQKFSTGALLPMTLQPGLCSEGEGKLLGPWWAPSSLEPGHPL